MKHESPLVGGFFLVALAMFSFLVAPGFVLAAPALTINYQGKLADDTGAVVTDGTYNMRFKLYTAASGGSPIWTETWCHTFGSDCTGPYIDGEDTISNDQRVTVTDGLFSLMLGTQTSLTSVDFDQPLYLSIEIGGTSEIATETWDGEMSPRKALGSVPSAFIAQRLNGLSSSQFLRSDATNATSTTNTALVINQQGLGALIDLQDGGVSAFKILDGGNVGIGTSTPYAKLSVVGETVSTYFTATSTTATSTFAGGVSAGALEVTGAATSTFAGGINLTTGCFAISGNCVGGSGGGSGTVGSGTTGQTSYYAGNGTSITATSTIFIDTTSYVGIGTASPSYQLSLAADSKIGIGSLAALYIPNQTSFVGSFFAGDGGANLVSAGANQGDHNTGVGIGAANALTSGYQNTAIGYQSLHLATSSAQNTSLGYLALRNTTSGSGNVALGVGTLSSNSTGSNNMGIGSNTLVTNTTGSENVGLGYQAVRLNSTGSYNVGIGSEALYSSTVTGSVAIGYRALYSASSGSYNTAVGYQAGKGASAHTTTGGVFIGYNAGAAITTGATNNTIIGAGSGETVSSGNGNILIGYQTANNLTSGSRNIAIGYDIDITNSTGSNQLNIGNFIFGTGIDGTAGTVSNAKIGIGTTTPVSTLSVQGSLCVRDDGSCGTTAGTIYATTASISDIDVAENFPTEDETLSAGEIVSVDPGDDEHIKRAENGEVVLGIISTQPGLLLGKEFTSGRPVALAGRVPVKVNDEGGPIEPGDLIALSTVPGVGRKATTSDEVTVGVAMGSLNDSAGEVIVFVSLERQRLADQQLFADRPEAEVKLRELVSSLGEWSLSADGVLTVKEIRADRLCLGETCIGQNELDRILRRLNIDAPEPAPEPEPEPDPEPEPTPESGPEVTPEPEIIPDPETVPQTDPEPDPEPEPETSVDEAPPTESAPAAEPEA